MRINCNYIVKKFETNSDFSEWFGYYNYDVISIDGKKMLCNRVNFDGRMITGSDRAELGWYDLDSGNWHIIDETNSFNWQQGAMLQWLPGEGNNDLVIYNVAENNHFKSVIYNIMTGEKKYIDFPTYCVTPDGKYSISLNYERSYWCRAYHYQSVVNKKYDVRIAQDDGIFKVDIDSNTVKRIIRIQDVLELDPLDDFDKAKHWLEHIMISKDGKHIGFLHRFSYGEGYITRLCVSDINGNNLHVCSGWRNNTWSHMGWKTDRSFVIYSVERGAIGAAYSIHSQKEPNSKKSAMLSVVRYVKKMIPQSVKRRISPVKQQYEVFEEQQGVFVHTKNYYEKLFDIDGHPSFTADGKYMITDSYPDKDGFQRLIIYNTENNRGIQIGSFEASLSGTPASCDLHPKLCYGDKYIVVDTAYTKKHKMIVFEILWDQVKEKIG